MPKYLVEGRYTADGLKGLVREASSGRRVDIATTIESAGGKLEASTSRLAMLTFIMTAHEMDQAIKKTKAIEFLPPGH
jgi:hypothetical protein